MGLFYMNLITKYVEKTYDQRERVSFAPVVTGNRPKRVHLWREQGREWNGWV